MARRRGGFDRVISQKSWVTTLHGQALNLDLAEGQVVAGDLALSIGESMTILRLRGHVFVQLNAGAAAERALVGVGIGLVSSTAFAAGVASLPSPVAEGGYPWIWHGYFSVSSGQEAAITDQWLVDRREIDSKAMRKMRQDQSLVLVAEIADSVDQTGEVNILYGTRVLFGA